MELKSDVGYTFSLNGEDFELDVESILEQIGEEKTIYVGEQQPILHEHFLSIDSMIENMQVNANDYSEYADDYLDNVTTEQSEELSNLILEYMNKNISQPNFYNAVNIQEISIEKFKELFSMENKTVVRMKKPLELDLKGVESINLDDKTLFPTLLLGDAGSGKTVILKEKYYDTALYSNKGVIYITYKNEVSSSIDLMLKRATSYGRDDIVYLDGISVDSLCNLRKNIKPNQVVIIKINQIDSNTDQLLNNIIYLNDELLSSFDILIDEINCFSVKSLKKLLTLRNRPQVIATSNTKLTNYEVEFPEKYFLKKRDCPPALALSYGEALKGTTVVKLVKDFENDDFLTLLQNCEVLIANSIADKQELTSSEIETLLEPIEYMKYVISHFNEDVKKRFEDVLDILYSLRRNKIINGLTK